MSKLGLVFCYWVYKDFVFGCSFNKVIFYFFRYMGNKIWEREICRFLGVFSFGYWNIIFYIFCFFLVNICIKL